MKRPWKKAERRLQQARLAIIAAGTDSASEEEAARARAAYNDLMETCRRHGLTGAAERRAA